MTLGPRAPFQCGVPLTILDVTDQAAWARSPACPVGDRLRMIGTHLACSRLAIVLLLICGKKLTAHEAEGSKPMVIKGPVMGWV